MKDERRKHHAVRANKYDLAGLKPGQSDTRRVREAPQAFLGKRRHTNCVHTRPFVRISKKAYGKHLFRSEVS